MVNYSELAVFVTSVTGSLVALVYATQKSKCSRIRCCCVDCERKTSDTIELPDLENQLANVADDKPDQLPSKSVQPPPKPPAPQGRAVKDNIFMRRDLAQKV